MNPVQYIFLTTSVPMTTGKAAAQAAHASVEGLRLNAKDGGNPWDSSIVNLWYRGGHYAKVILGTNDPILTQKYLKDRGFDSALIIDEGRTEFDEDLTATALGCPVLDKDQGHVRETFSVFSLFSSPSPVVVLPAAPDKPRWLARLRG